MTLTEENNLTREQLLEMLYEAWGSIDFLRKSVETLTEKIEQCEYSYDDGYDDGYVAGKEAVHD